MGVIESDVRVVELDLPESVAGYTMRSADDYYTIVLNSRLNASRNLATYSHEMAHIMREDFSSSADAGLIEIYAHNEL
ncbi:hypothetical protein [Shuttleworthella satelles]|uniref:IrrE N-terminal-like domain-containing protein n=1 Tax=Shuttleworthella satelles DSM 14600 TaxID=626523 RepID=C4GAV1_9FIRM|nr:hypothetical protein [Shuttleworthia satelles]EEP28244.1 hypothetical protein GCWU000342_01052 [Shuttleworthia satelles DSM 14600]